MEQYYRFDRTYMVRARSKYEARVKFSRALENREEDQYYVGTNIESSTKDQQPNRTKLVLKLLKLMPWFLEEARNQIFGYPQYKRF